MTTEILYFCSFRREVETKTHTVFLIQRLENAENACSATILDKINGSGPPPPPISMMPKWRVFAPSRLHHCFGGEGGERGIIVPFCSVQDYIPGQNKWNIWTTPPPISMMPKLRDFAPSRLHHCFGGRGIIVPFYSVQDCSYVMK